MTGERGWFDTGRAVVVARALPVTDAEPIVPDLDDELDVSPPFGIDAILALTALFGAVVSAQWLRGRTSPMVVFVAVAPMAVFGVIRVLLLFDSALPIAR